MDSKVKREERAKLIEQARSLIEAAKNKNRDLTAEENEQFDKLHADADKLKAEIDRMERQERTETELRQAQPTIAGGRETEVQTPDNDPEERKRLVNAAFRSWLVGGMGTLTPEQRAAMQERYSELTPEQRALAAGTDSAGGFTVPEDFRDVLETAMKAFGGMRQSRAEIIPSATGAPLPMPTSNDTNNVGSIIAENTQITEDDMTFGQVTLGAFTYTSLTVRVSLQLLQDSAFNLNQWLAERLGERIGRATNAHFTVGTGTNQPQGITVGATLGKQGETGQVDTVTYFDLVDLQHSVDPAYRPNSEWMFHDTTLAALKKLVDSEGRPLWSPGIAVREPDTILGRPFVINQDMPVMAADARSIIFGDLSKYIIRDVQGVQLLRLVERYADFLQVGFIAYSRHDGAVIDAGTNPIKFYANSSS